MGPEGRLQQVPELRARIFSGVRRWAGGGLGWACRRPGAPSELPPAPPPGSEPQPEARGLEVPPGLPQLGGRRRGAQGARAQEDVSEPQHGARPHAEWRVLICTSQRPAGRLARGTAPGTWHSTQHVARHPARGMAPGTWHSTQCRTQHVARRTLGLSLSCAGQHLCMGRPAAGPGLSLRCVCPGATLPHGHCFAS